MKTKIVKKVKVKKEASKDYYKDYNYLNFLYNATHPKAYCSSTPHQIYIEMTNVCNLRCSHCPRSTMRRKPQYMDIKLFKKIVKEISPYKPFVDLYLQGESLLHPKIVEIVKIAKQAGLLPRITSNCTLLKKELAKKLISAGLNKIEFSISGATKETYESIHKGATFEKTLNNILDFLEENAKAGFPVHTRTVFVEEEKTKNDKARYLELFSKLPIDHVYISPLINMFGWNKEINLNPFKSLPKEKWPVCKCPWRQIGINSDGTVRACIFDYDSRYLIGDANKENVIDVWNGKKMQNFRQTIINKKYEEFDKPGLPLCTECSQIWPTGDKTNDSTQFPHDFNKEVETFFTEKQTNLKAKYLNPEIKNKKAEYLKKHRSEWLKNILTSD